MKKQVIFALWTVVAAFSAMSLYAQDTIAFKSLPPVTITGVQKTVPEKVWTNFRTYFGNADNPKWYAANKNFLIKFMTDEKLNHALFTKRGNLIYHISFGYEKNLPKDIRDQLKGTYYDYDITRAIKVTEADRQIWLVNLEDTKTYILVRLEDGDMEEVQKFRKS